MVLQEGRKVFMSSLCRIRNSVPAPPRTDEPDQAMPPSAELSDACSSDGRPCGVGLPHSFTDNDATNELITYFALYFIVPED